MTPEDLLADLESSGLTLRREGGQLLVSPASALTPQNRAQIKEHKQGLLVALSVRQAMADALPATLEESDALGESVRLVERVVLVWPDGEAMAFDPEFVRQWEEWNAGVRKRGTGCRHEETEFGRLISRKGTTHVMERCLACRQNARGAGKWVPGKDLPVSPDQLPVFSDQRAGAGLFG